MNVSIGEVFNQATKTTPTLAVGSIESAATDVHISEVIDGRNNFSRNVKFQRICIGNLFDLFCVSAEPSTELQKLIPFHGAIPVGYIGDVFGYWPTERQRQEGGYEAGLFVKTFSLNGRFRADLDKKFANTALRKRAKAKPFWPSTSRYKLDALFSFDWKMEDETRVRYTGHHIELIDQSNATRTGRQFPLLGSGLTIDAPFGDFRFQLTKSGACWTC